MIFKKLSFSNRLFLAVSLVLTAFLGLSAISLNNAFQASTDSAQRKELKHYIYSLLMAAEFDEQGKVSMINTLSEPKFSTPNSGLYAQITSERDILWQSKSLLGLFLALPAHPGVNNEVFSTIVLNNDINLLNLAYGIVWENSEGEKFNYTLNISKDLNTRNQQQKQFQLSLWYWLGGTGLMLLIAQAFILRWGLRPLHNVAIDLNAIKSGDHARLSEDYPKELNQLTQNINTLLDHEHDRRNRYKNSLADLAHSLKTPLAIIRGELESTHVDPTLRSTTLVHIDRISELVNYQLQRASTEGKNSFQAPVSLGEIIYKIISSLDKVYQNKQVHHQCEISSNIFIHADEGDMYELLGNLLENAYKYCTHQVAVLVTNNHNTIEINIDDDGKGIPKEAKELILKRGKRIDIQIEGHGLGLAIASDIINAYQGEIQLHTSHLGGARFLVILPQQ